MLGLMATPDRRRWLLIAGAVLLPMSALVLAGCSPVERSAVRVNHDGTVDFASCIALGDVTDIDATTHLRTAPNGSVDDATETRLTLEGTVTSLAVGQVITLRGLPQHWDRMDIYVDGTSESVGAPIERDAIVVGEWYWGDGPTLFGATFIPADRCTLLDGDGLPVE